MSWCLYIGHAAIAVGNSGDHVTLTIQTETQSIVLQLSRTEADILGEQLALAAEGSSNDAELQDSLFGNLGAAS